MCEDCSGIAKAHNGLKAQNPRAARRDRTSVHRKARDEKVEEEECDLDDTADGAAR